MNVSIIGAGPGGYVAAIRCAQLGFQVTLIEKYITLGGTCLNVGCIPSKALLDSTEHVYKMHKEFSQHGIQVDSWRIDFERMMQRKDEVVQQNTKGIEYLMKKNKIRVIQATAEFSSPSGLLLKKADGSEEQLSFDRCIIATGSKPLCPPAFHYDKKRIISSTEALNLKEIPKSLAIIGAGVIGLEMGSVFARLGTQVEIVEYMDQILNGMDPDCAEELQKSLKKLGIKFSLGRSVTSVETKSREIQLKHTDKKGTNEQTLVADYALIAIGRRPYTEGLALEKAGVLLNEKGFIRTNEELCTANPNVYAIGDVVGGAMLAHKAEEEAVFISETIAGQKPHISYHLIPSVVYTWPEMASVGYTEVQLKARGISYNTGKFPFKALGRSRASMDVDGLVKVISDANSDELLGIHIVGARAADLIMEGVSLMEFKASAEDMSMMSHPHPTYSEALKEAALEACGKRAIHL